MKMKFYILALSTLLLSPTIVRSQNADGEEARKAVRLEEIRKQLMERLEERRKIEEAKGSAGAKDTKEEDPKPVAQERKSMKVPPSVMRIKDKSMHVSYSCNAMDLSLFAMQMEEVLGVKIIVARDNTTTITAKHDSEITALELWNQFRTIIEASGNELIINDNEVAIVHQNKK